MLIKKGLVKGIISVGLSFSTALILPAMNVFAYTGNDGVTYEWRNRDKHSYWYENGVRQGTYDDPQGVLGDDAKVRGREIFDSESNAWYWLDSVYNGAKAVNKEVWMPYIYQGEDTWGDEEIEYNASFSGDMSEQVKEAIHNHGNKESGKWGKWVRYDANGAMIKGWYRVEGDDVEFYPDQKNNIYYYDERTGLMAKGTVNIDGVSYHFDEVSGVLDTGVIPDYFSESSTDDSNNKTKDETNKNTDAENSSINTDNGNSSQSDNNTNTGSNNSSNSETNKGSDDVTNNNSNSGSDNNSGSGAENSRSTETDNNSSSSNNSTLGGGNSTSGNDSNTASDNNISSGTEGNSGSEASNDSSGGDNNGISSETNTYSNSGTSEESNSSSGNESNNSSSNESNGGVENESNSGTENGGGQTDNNSGAGNDGGSGTENNNGSGSGGFEMDFSDFKMDLGDIMNRFYG